MTDSAATERAPIAWGEPGTARYSIGELVLRTGVPASSVHHYRRLGLLPEPTRGPAKQSVYDDRHVAALTAVRSLRARGCTLAEIYDVVQDLGCGDDLEQVGDRNPETKLIDAAIVAFGEHGFHEVSIAALCERAEVAKGTFYRCFDSKQALFLAAAQAVITRATDAFAAEAGAAPPAAHPELFARHLRHGLPLLFELAKRLTQDADPAIEDAAAMFADLARRLGRTVSPAAADDQAEPAGGLLIMLALVKIFEELLGSQITRPATVTEP